jgi:hypothetical protein
VLGVAGRSTVTLFGAWPSGVDCSVAKAMLVSWTDPSLPLGALVTLDQLGIECVSFLGAPVRLDQFCPESGDCFCVS